MTTFVIAVLLAVAAVAAEKPAPHVFEAAKVTDVFRVLLDRDALLLESIEDVIRQKGILDGHVTVTAGSVQECSYHFVTTTDAKPKDEFKTVKGPFEILNAGGIIAAGQPHIHITLSAANQGAFGGHLENGCKVLYLAEVTILKYAGPALTRKPNAQGVSILQTK